MGIVINGQTFAAPKSSTPAKKTEPKPAIRVPSLAADTSNSQRADMARRAMVVKQATAVVGSRRYIMVTRLAGDGTPRYELLRGTDTRTGLPTNIFSSQVSGQIFKAMAMPFALEGITISEHCANTGKPYKDNIAAKIALYGSFASEVLARIVGDYAKALQAATVKALLEAKVDIGHASDSPLDSTNAEYAQDEETDTESNAGLTPAAGTTTGRTLEDEATDTTVQTVEPEYWCITNSGKFVKFVSLDKAELNSVKFGCTVATAYAD